MSVTAQELDAAYERGRKASPNETNPFQHYHPALRQEWDAGQRDAEITRMREPAPVVVRVAGKLLLGLLAVVTILSVINSLQ